jgi:hypothetical protein
MNLVKEDVSEPILKIFNPIPVPVNPFPNTSDDPYRPPYEVYCGDKQQLND